MKIRTLDKKICKQYIDLIPNLDISEIDMIGYTIPNKGKIYVKYTYGYDICFGENVNITIAYTKIKNSMEECIAKASFAHTIQKYIPENNVGKKIIYNTKADLLVLNSLNKNIFNVKKPVAIEVPSSDIKVLKNNIIDVCNDDLIPIKREELKRLLQQCFTNEQLDEMGIDLSKVEEAAYFGENYIDDEYGYAGGLYFISNNIYYDVEITSII